MVVFFDGKNDDAVFFRDFEVGDGLSVGGFELVDVNAVESDVLFNGGVDDIVERGMKQHARDFGCRDDGCTDDTVGTGAFESAIGGFALGSRDDVEVFVETARGERDKCVGGIIGEG